MEETTRESSYTVKIDKEVSFKEMLITPYSKTVNPQTTSRTNLEEDMLIDEPAGNVKTNTESTIPTNEGMEAMNTDLRGASHEH
ncbi:hypothetical protein KY290_010392 [Solanum tuberosum]|uniref:Uncharacterized protein n=1 Tax=Solanum tuberosum TaxID=4113 RepID=A0ABQ7VYA2_SOLTU|nr:hypothetical protein KY284_010306 [Solanum tuberosum]KAH0773255.1 hypothetical protein KY290_010392 [Solanum tuberosum]